MERNELVGSCPKLISEEQNKQAELMPPLVVAIIFMQLIITWRRLRPVQNVSSAIYTQ